MRIKNLFNELKNVKMTETEKSHIRAQLVQLTGAHVFSPKTAKPTLEQYRTKNQPGIRKSPYSDWSFTSNFRTVGAAVLVLILASTGVSFAAEKTLPGDLLYPVKVNVNEEVRGALTISNTDKMDWEKERVVRRVIETEILIKTNNFTPKRKAEAETALKTQMATFAAAAAETSVKDPNAVIAATAELEPALKVHQEVITNLTADMKVDATSNDTENILSTVARGITAASQQETVAIDVAVDKNPSTLVALTDDKITSAMNAIDASAPEKKIIDADAAVKGDVETKIDSKSDIKTDTTTDPGTGSKTDVKVDIKVDTKSIQAPEVQSKESTSAKVSTPSLMSATLEKVSDAAPTPDPKEILAAAKEKLRQARILREKGDLKGALTLAQDAYKDMVALKLQAKLATKKAIEDAKVEPTTISTTKGEVKGAQTDSTSSTTTNSTTDTKTDTKTDATSTATTPPSSILKN